MRWPSTESLAKILAATGTSLDDFVHLLPGGEPEPLPARPLPLVRWAQAGGADYFDGAGFPMGSGWEEMAFPDLSDTHAYALEIAGDSMLPIYRDGDRVLVSPSANLRRGDRVIVKTLSGELMATQLARLAGQRIEVKSFNPVNENRAFSVGELAFVHRIVWASQ
ncbi:MAG: S24 family peptidase [Rhizomicrobium sp.]